MKANCHKICYILTHKCKYIIDKDDDMTGMRLINEALYASELEYPYTNYVDGSIISTTEHSPMPLAMLHVDEVDFLNSS